MLGVVAASTLLAGTVSAYPLPANFKMKFQNIETFTYQGGPGPGIKADGIEDNWGIADITNIYDLKNGSLAPAVWNEGDSHEHLRLVYWGLDVYSWPSDPGGFQTSAATQTDGGVAIPYAGAALYLWKDNVAGYVPFTDNGPGGRIGFDGYNGISTGPAVLQSKFQFAPGIFDSDPNVLTNGNTFGAGNPPTGQGAGYFDVIPGSGPAAGLLDTNGFATALGNRDVYFQFNFRTPRVADPATTFQLYSEDPLLGHGVVPEPSTIVLLGAGLLGLGLTARKRLHK